MVKNILVILNYNDFKMCDRLLKKIKNYSELYKIILVDNLSTDDSYEKLKKLHSTEKIDFIQAPNNGGYASGNNFGINYGIETYAPEIIYIANPDVLFEECVVKKISALLQNNFEYGIAAPIVVQGYNVWNQPGFWGVIESLFLIIFNMDKAWRKRNIIRRGGNQEVGVVEGSFFAIRRDVFDKIQGFDERTFLYYEENIIGYKLKEHHYKSVVLVDATYEHLHSQSIKKEYRSKANAFRCFYDSALLYLKEYLKAGQLQILIFAVAYRLAYWERKVYDFVKRAGKY